MKIDKIQLPNGEILDIAMSGVYTIKGSVANYASLPTTDNEIGDVYNVLDTGANYVWTAEGWDKLSETVDLSGYALKTELEEGLATKANVTDVYTQTQINSQLAEKANVSDVYTIAQVNADLELKADKANIYNKTEIDEQLSTKANKSDVYTQAQINSQLAGKQDKLTAGTGIIINNNVISASESGSSTVAWGDITGDITNQTDLTTYIEEYAGNKAGTSLPLFTPIIQDHILSYEESKGYAQEGTYVYKETAPERYGYPDFYAKCLEEKAAGTATSLKNNVTKVGSLTINNGVLSGFSSANYATFSPPSGTINSFEIQMKFTTGSDVSTTQVIMGQNTTNMTTPQIGLSSGDGAGFFEILVSSDSAAWNGGLYNKNNPLLPNTTYIVNCSWNGTKLTGSLITNGITIPLVSQNDRNDSRSDVFSSVVWTDTTQLGADIAKNTFTGSIDLKESYININGKRWWHGAAVGYKNNNGHCFYDIVDKTYIDSIYSSSGSAWYYGIDEQNQRILLPQRIHGELIEKYTKGTQGYRVWSDGYCEQWGVAAALAYNTKTTNVTFLKKFKDANYNFLATPLGGGHAVDGASYLNKSATAIAVISGYQGGANTGDDVEWRASGYLASGQYSTENNNNLYIVVGNTEQTPAAIEATDITTSENDTIPLFTGMYFDFAPNNPSWLKAGTQQNSGGIYTTCYNTLVNCLNGDNPYGIKVVDSSLTTSGVDYSGYWIVNQTAQTFTTPTKLSFGMLNPTVNTVPVVGNGNAIGIYGQKGNTTDTYGMVSLDIESNNRETLLYGSSYGKAGDSGAMLGTSNKNSVFYTGLSKDSAKSGMVANISSAVSDNAKLYFKVANAVQNTEILDVGKVMEVLADKVDSNGSGATFPYITTTYTNGASGYIIWSNKYCEQWGTGSSGTSVSITLLKKMKDTNYRVFLQETGAYSSNATANYTVLSKAVSSFTYGGTANTNGLSWTAKGYMA